MSCKTKLTRHELEQASGMALYFYARREGWEVPDHLKHPTAATLIEPDWREEAICYLLGEVKRPPG